MNNDPPEVNAILGDSLLELYETIPEPTSLTRSRRDCSSFERTWFPPSNKRLSGSASICRFCECGSSVHNLFTGSEPEDDCKKEIRLFFEAIANDRGAPTVNLRVLACCCGNVSICNFLLPSSTIFATTVIFTIESE